MPKPLFLHFSRTFAYQESGRFYWLWHSFPTFGIFLCVSLLLARRQLKSTTSTSERSRGNKYFGHTLENPPSFSIRKRTFPLLPLPLIYFFMTATDSRLTFFPNLFLNRVSLKRSTSKQPNLCRAVTGYNSLVEADTNCRGLN